VQKRGVLGNKSLARHPQKTQMGVVLPRKMSWKRKESGLRRRRNLHPLREGTKRKAAEGQKQKKEKSTRGDSRGKGLQPAGMRASTKKGWRKKGKESKGAGRSAAF